MVRSTLIDEIHLFLHVPEGLPNAEYTAICRSLRAARFLAGLTRACQGAIKQFPALRKVRISLAR